MKIQITLDDGSVSTWNLTLRGRDGPYETWFIGSTRGAPICHVAAEGPIRLAISALSRIDYERRKGHAK